MDPESLPPQDGSQIEQSIFFELKKKEGQEPLAMHEQHERSEAVMEQARGGRVELFKKIALSRVSQMVEAPIFLKMLNYVPVVGDANLLAGAVRGQEGGMQLTAGERLNYAAAVSMGVLSWISLYQGNVTAAGLEQTISYTLVNMDAIPVVLKNSAKLLERKVPKLAKIMSATADFMMRKREEFAKLGELFRAVTPSSTDLPPIDT